MIEIQATHDCSDIAELARSPVEMNLTLRAKDTDELKAILAFLADSIEDIADSIAPHHEIPF